MALGPSQPPVQWVLGAVFSGVERPADRLRLAGARLTMSQATPAFPRMPTWHTQGKLCFTIFIWLAE
jgi:hypothetical protein